MYYGTGWPDPDGCPDGTRCPECVPLRANIEWAGDSNRKKQSTEHLGGNSIGWLDGYASRVQAEGLPAMAKHGEIEGLYNEEN
jgi:hypothetical protein